MIEHPTGIRLTAPASPPVCWTRVERNERRFIRKCADHTDGVVIGARFLGLVAEALSARVPHIVDLETHRLPFLCGADDHSFGRDATTPLGREVVLPMRPEHFANEAAAEPLVRAAIGVQATAAATFAPDFAFDALDSRWLEVNLRCLRMTRELTRDRPVAAWIHVTLETAMSGIMPFVAKRYSSVLPAGSTVALTVYLPQRLLDIDEQTGYFRAVAALADAGFEVLVDRAGDLAIPAVATFAAGCMLGTRLYRTAPQSPRWSSEINPRIPLTWSDARRGRRLSLRMAGERQGRRTLPPCQERCKPVAPDARDKLAGRLHNAHDVRNEVRRCRQLGLGQALLVWRNSRYKKLRGWAQALDRAMAESAEA